MENLNQPMEAENNNSGGEGKSDLLGLDQTGKKPKSRLFIFAAIFLGIIIIFGGGYWVWNTYFSPQAKLNRQNEENYKKYQEFEANYEKAMRGDTYGGKTPEETLSMFIDALKKGDIDTASKYFALDTNERSPYYLTRKEWEDGLKKAKDEGKIDSILAELEKARLTETSDKLSTAFLSVFDGKGQVTHEILLEFNKYSSVWKIESM